MRGVISVPCGTPNTPLHGTKFPNSILRHQRRTYQTRQRRYPPANTLFCHWIYKNPPTAYLIGDCNKMRIAENLGKRDRASSPRVLKKLCKRYLCTYGICSGINLKHLARTARHCIHPSIECHYSINTAFQWDSCKMHFCFLVKNRSASCNYRSEEHTSELQSHVN